MTAPRVYLWYNVMLIISHLHKSGCISCRVEVLVLKHCIVQQYFIYSKNDNKNLPNKRLNFIVAASIVQEGMIITVHRNIFRLKKRKEYNMTTVKKTFNFKIYEHFNINIEHTGDGTIYALAISDFLTSNIKTSNAEGPSGNIFVYA